MGGASKEGPLGFGWPSKFEKKKNVKKGARSIFRSQKEIKKPIKVRNSIDSRICFGHYFIILFSKMDWFQDVLALVKGNNII